MNHRPGAERAERVLVVHARYRFPGGEEAVVEAEAELLRSHGHDVQLLQFDNDAWASRAQGMRAPQAAFETVWSNRARRAVAAAMKAFRPDVVHVHNTFPSISPSIYSVVDRPGVAVVQTLHNFRWLCPVATFFRDGQACTDCLGRIPWPAVIHACYRDSRALSGLVGIMLTVHRGLGTWTRHIDRFIALTPFSRELFVRGGLPEARIDVKPNFLEPDPAAGNSPATQRRKGALYVGRLAPEKGVDVLLRAAAMMPGRIRIAGEGPLRGTVEEAASAGLVSYLGPIDRSAVLAAMRESQLLVFPSLCFEGGVPLVIVEAHAAALPVVASALGRSPEIVRDGVTGALVPEGDAEALADRIRDLMADESRLAAMGSAGRKEYLDLYRGERNYVMLLNIYASALRRAARRHVA